LRQIFLPITKFQEKKYFILILNDYIFFLTTIFYPFIQNIQGAEVRVIDIYTFLVLTGGLTLGEILKGVAKILLMEIK
jgi:hypothetical protein